MSFIFGRSVRVVVVASCVAAPAALPGSAAATDGYFQAGFGAIQKSLADAGLANPEDSMTLATNPAGLVFVGRQVNASLSAFMPFRGYTASQTGFIAPGRVDSGGNIFAVPALGYSHPLDAVSAVGIAVVGNGGLNTAYDAVPNPAPGCAMAKGSGVFCGGRAGVDLNQAFVTFGYARQFGRVSLGVAPVIGVQAFKAFGLGMFAAAGMSSDPQNFTDRGYAWSYGLGLRLGLQWDVAKGLRLAASGATKTYMSKFDKYAGHFANQGAFDVPANISLGVAWDALPTLTLMASYKRIFYSGVPAIADSMLTPQLFGTTGGPGFGWRDVTVLSVGGAWAATSRLTLRAGTSWNTNPVTAREVAINILAPGLVTRHLTAGFGHRVTPQSSIDVAAVYAPRQSVSGPVPASFYGGAVDVRLSEFEATLSYTYRFDAGSGPALIR